MGDETSGDAGERNRRREGDRQGMQDGVKSKERSARQSAEPTRARILEAAEKLFADRGLHGVAMRDIAREAGVDAALIHYHFGSKADLFGTALVTRAEDFMDEREKALADCIEKAGGKPSLEDVIVAYTQPYLDHALSGDPGWKSWFKLLATASLSLDWAPDIWRDRFDPFVKKFIDALKLAAPGAPESRYYWCYHFFSGALVLTFAETGRMENLSDGACRSGDLAEGYDLLVAFMAQAFEAILSGQRPPLGDPFGRTLPKDHKPSA